MTRKRKVIIWGLLLLTAGLPAAAGCGGAEPERVYAEPADHVDQRLVDGNTRFGFDLFHRLAGESPGQNLLISPASVSAALAMTINGAAGETSEAMMEALQLQGMSLAEMNQAFNNLITILRNPDPRVALVVANSLWARAGVPFKEDFLQRNRDYFEAELAELDFNAPQAADAINGWVREQTRGKIAEIVKPPINPLTVLFLINAIYFNGTWTEQFDKKLTSELPFHLPDGTSKDYPIMFQSGSYRYLKEDSFEAISLPYGDKGRVSMYLFLPAPDSSLAGFYRDLNPENWAHWTGSFSEREGEIGLPRFKFAYEKSLNESLKALGMEVAFDQGEADFSGMRPIPPNLFISEVKHKTFIEVNEVGTEAAAVTSVEMTLTAMPVDKFNMIVDRPFFFAIVDNQTGTILFMGAVSDPGAS
ncbi:MAG: serpin family protein [Bacillota bacterium]